MITLPLEGIGRVVNCIEYSGGHIIDCVCGIGYEDILMLCTSSDNYIYLIDVMAIRVICRPLGVDQKIYHLNGITDGNVYYSVIKKDVIVTREVNINYFVPDVRWMKGIQGYISDEYEVFMKELLNLLLINGKVYEIINDLDTPGSQGIGVQSDLSILKSMELRSGKRIYNMKSYYPIDFICRE